jgi:hypothetical protein
LKGIVRLPVGARAAEVEAVVRRADGRVEPLGVVARAWREPRRLGRLAALALALARLRIGTLVLAGLAEGLALASVVTNAGKDVITNRVKGSGTEPSYIGWGTGSDGGAGSTNLVSPAAEARAAGTSSRVTTTTTNDTYQVVGTLTCAGSGKTITEVGLFDAAGSGSPPSGGSLAVYADHSGIALNVGDSITYTVKVQLT